MTRILPFFAETATATITIDGVVYRVPLIDSDGHLQVDVLTSLLPTGAATSAKQDTMITALQLIDDLRGALDAVKADRLNVNAFATGASEVKNIWASSVAPTTTRLTILTPTSGKKVRIVACGVHSRDTTSARVGVYFGTGADIGSPATKAIVRPYLDADIQPSFGMTWPDGGGPVGDADEVVSFRAVPDITTMGGVVLQYREE